MFGRSRWSRRANPRPRGMAVSEGQPTRQNSLQAGWHYMRMSNSAPAHAPLPPPWRTADSAHACLMRKFKKLTLARIAVHDFNRALRVWQTQLDPIDIFEQLVGQRSKAMIHFMRSLPLAIAGVLWLAANKPELALKVSLIDISVPAAYVNFGVALLFFTALQNLINWALLNEFVRIASARLFKFEGGTLSVFLDGGSAGSLALAKQYRFLSSGRWHSALGPMMLSLLCLPFLAILVAGYWTYFPSEPRFSGAMGYFRYRQPSRLSAGFCRCFQWLSRSSSSCPSSLLRTSNSSAGISCGHFTDASERGRRESASGFRIASPRNESTIKAPVTWLRAGKNFTRRCSIINPA